MPRHCVAASCDTKSEMGYSLHGFPQNEVLQNKWVRVVNAKEVTGKVHRWVHICALNTLKSTALIVTEGVHYCEAMDVSTVK